MKKSHQFKYFSLLFDLIIYKRSTILSNDENWYPNWIEKGNIKINNTIVGTLKPLAINSS